jgi:hypothetical protein
MKHFGVPTLWPRDHFEYCVVFLVYSPSFGILSQEKSGNPDEHCRLHMQRLLIRMAYGI